MGRVFFVLSRQALHSFKGYCFVEILWGSLTKVLSSKELSFIFSVGVADSFYQNFLIAEELISEFHSACVKPKSQAFLEETQVFKSKWNLSTYFYLRNNVFFSFLLF